LSTPEALARKRSRPLHFNDWLPEEFAERGAFTAVIVLVAINETAVTPLATSVATISDDETGWEEMAEMLTESGRAWDAVAFFAIEDGNGEPVDDAGARVHLAALSARIAADRLVLNEGHFFGRRGSRLAIEEVGLHSSISSSLGSVRSERRGYALAIES
jgi:hypothetical protein